MKSKIKILKLSPYYYPEHVSSSHLSDDLEEALISAGADIEIYAPRPTRGINDEIRKKYKKIKYEELNQGHIKLHRFSMFDEKRNPIIRGIRYILVNVIQYFMGIKVKGVDVIYAASTPPTQGVLCAKVAKKLSKKYRKKVPFVYNLQDVFPDSLVSAGLTSKGSVIWKIGRKIEDYTYKNADTIIVISEDIKRNITKKGVDESKIRVISNWVDTDEIVPVSKENNILYDEFGLDKNTFKIVYAGNIGKMQGIDMLIDVAVKLKEDAETEIIIFGDGVEKENLIKRIKKEELKNIHIYPLQPSDKVSAVYSLGDVCLVSCKKGLGKGAFPSKTVSIMATGTAIIAAFDNDSELCGIVDKYDIGVCVEPENADEFVEAVNVFKNNRNLLKIKGSNGRKIVENKFSKTICIKEYLRVFGIENINSDKE